MTGDPTHTIYKLNHINKGNFAQTLQHGRSSLTIKKDHHYFLNRFVCVGEFIEG